MNNSFTSWDAELHHSGIKGMRWGIRRYQNEDGSLTEVGKKRYGIKGMTDAELKQRIDRLRMEKEYRELNKSRIGRSIDYIRKYNKERADNKEKIAKFKSAKTAEKLSNPFRKAFSTLLNKNVEAVAGVSTKILDKVGTNLSDLVPNAEQTKKGANWVAKNVKASASKAKEGAKNAAAKAKEKAQKINDNARNAYFERERRRRNRNNPWAW